MPADDRTRGRLGGNCLIPGFARHRMTAEQMASRHIGKRAVLPCVVAEYPGHIAEFRETAKRSRQQLIVAVKIENEVAVRDQLIVRPFAQDGVRMNDPGSHTFFGTGIDASGIEIPEEAVDYSLANDVPHGDVRIRIYHSKITGEWRRCFIYTPPDYDSNLTARYPVLYLQHGSGEDETGWIFQGHANLILDNLIAEKRAVPMIIVMDNGYASKPAGLFAPSSTGPAANFATFEDVMIQEVIPMIDSTFRTIPDRDHRAMAGLSMGANEALHLATDHLDTFTYMAGFSGTMNGLSTAPLDPATAFHGVFKDGPAFNAKVKLLWLGMGTKEPNPFPKAIGAFRSMLDKAGIKYVYFSSPGTSHEWLTWRRDLNDFAPRLFRQ